MALNWDNVEAIRSEHKAAQKRYNESVIPTDETVNAINRISTAQDLKVSELNRYEVIIMKLRAQLIDYIVAHGLVDGWIVDGILQPVKNGKIVITKELIRQITDTFGYFTEEQLPGFLEKYLPENFYVSDEHYIHTDNNYTDDEKTKLNTVEEGAEVNKVIDIVFNGKTVLDGETRIATINITKEDIKAWYESNTNTNAFTDEEKQKLSTIKAGAEPNLVNDVRLDGSTIVENKVANLTATKIKTSYESNENTNAFTDADKSLLESVVPNILTKVNEHENEIDALQVSQEQQDAKISGLTNSITNLTNDLNDAKDSISELGDETNSVAGRVTALETSQAAQDTEINKNTTDITALVNELNSLTEAITNLNSAVSLLEYYQFHRVALEYAPTSNETIDAGQYIAHSLTIANVKDASVLPPLPEGKTWSFILATTGAFSLDGNIVMQAYAWGDGVTIQFSNPTTSTQTIRGNRSYNVYAIAIAIEPQ